MSRRDEDPTDARSELQRAHRNHLTSTRRLLGLIDKQMAVTLSLEAAQSQAERLLAEAEGAEAGSAEAEQAQRRADFARSEAARVAALAKDVRQALQISSSLHAGLEQMIARIKADIREAEGEAAGVDHERAEREILDQLAGLAERLAEAGGDLEPEP